jgi:hypothetical protein
MCILQLHMRCYNKVFEVAPDEKEKAELFVEEVMGHVLLALFGEAIVDDVTITFSSDPQMALHQCSISITAQCSCKSFVLSPRSEEHMKRAIDQRISSILKEFFVTVETEDVTFRHAPWECEYDAVLSYRM